MNRKFFTLLVALMSLSILGIIAVQLVWINNAIRVKNELFDRSVNEALVRTAQRLEEESDVSWVADIMGNDTLFRRNHSPMMPPMPPRPVHVRTFPGGHIQMNHHKNQNLQVISLGKKSGGTLAISTSVSGTRLDTVVTQSYTFVQSSNAKFDSLQALIDTIHLSVPQVRQRLSQKASSLKKLGRQVVTEMILSDHSEVPVDKAQEIFARELENKNIGIPFQLAILENDTIRTMSAEADSVALQRTKYQTDLFPHAVFERNSKVSVWFPGQAQYLYRSVSWLLVASFFFSLIILLTFALSLWFMLNQKKISQMKTDFINNMTHEFKTPIATISVAADSIANEKVIGDPERVRYFTGMIKKENTRMNRQVEDILTIARLDKKDFEFIWEAVNIHQLIESAMQSILLQVDKRGGEIQMDLQAENPVVTSDKTHCTNVIYNLLDNANKYSADAPHISITTRNTARGVVLSVTDQGIGMSKTVQSKVFERFYRQTSGNIHNVKGFGLGLSYVKAVVEANQGTISLRSEPGNGSCFDVFFPFHRNDGEMKNKTEI